MDKILKWFEVAKERPYFAIFCLFLSVMIISAVAYLAAFSSEHGRQAAQPKFPETITVTTETFHIGAENKKDYPSEKEGGIVERTFSFQIKSIPKTAQLLIEGFDVDLIGASVSINNTRIGGLRVGDPWQETQLPIPVEFLKAGDNAVTVKSKVWSDGECEDCLFRNIRIALTF